jgi:DNA-binding NarL/FixJ family response regulator
VQSLSDGELIMDDDQSVSLPRSAGSTETCHIQVTVPWQEGNAPRVIIVIANGQGTGHAVTAEQDLGLAALPGFDDLLKLALKPSIDALSSAMADVVRRHLPSMQSGDDVAAIRQPHISRGLTPESVGESFHQKSIPDTGFSKRELEVLRLLVDGCSNKSIARQMEIAETTVKIYVRRILNKTQSSNRTQAVLWALEQLGGNKGAERVVAPTGTQHE